MSEFLESYKPKLHPFIDFVYEDKSHYETAESNHYIDKDNDFLVGLSGGIIMKWDFVFVNTEEFSKTANNFVKFGCYTQAKIGTQAYLEFWKKEKEYRKRGKTLNCKLYQKDISAYLVANPKDREKYLHPLRITGDHYNYLNYGRINRTPTEQERRDLDNLGLFKQKHIPGFPRFWDGDYWNFKLDEFISNNGLNLGKAKARRKGYSHKRGSQAANTMNLYAGSTIVLLAYDITYLTDPGATSSMVKTNLDWFENNTAWRRGYLSEDLSAIELGYKKQKEGNKKYGYRSHLLSLTCRNNPSVGIGKGAMEIDVEEGGKCKNLDKVLSATTSATEIGAGFIGTIRVYGTTGVEDADWVAFANMFYAPRGYNMLAMENIWDKNSRHTVCGFFHPQILDYEPYIDKHGNSQLISSFEYDANQKEDKRKNLSPSEYQAYCGQRANSPEEAFNGSQENLFNSPELAMHVTHIRQEQDTIHFRDGAVIETDRGIVFKTNVELKHDGIITHPYITHVPFKKDDDIHGCVREFFPPPIVNGTFAENLCFAVYDPVGKDKDVKEIIVKNSLSSIYIWGYPNPFIPQISNKLLAVYVGRTNSMESMNRNLLNMCKLWHCKALVETDRGTTIQDFKRWKALQYLIKDPIAQGLSDKNTINLNPNYGISMSSKERIDDALLYLRDLLYTQVSYNIELDSPTLLLHYINDLPTLLELQNFSKIGNFDRISALRLIPYVLQLYRLKNKQSNPTNQVKTSFLSTINLYGE